MGHETQITEFKFTAAELLETLRACPLSSYRIAAETGLHQTSIQNYRSGRQKPNARARGILSKYFRLGEYVVNREAAERVGEPFPSYEAFIKKYGYNPIVEKADEINDPLFQPDTRGVRKRSDSPLPFTDEDVSLFPGDPALAPIQDDYLRYFIPLRDELEAAHNLISTMRESNAFLMAEVSKLRALVSEKQ